MNETYRENASLIKDALNIDEYLRMIGVNIRGNRAICPICHNPKFTMAITPNRKFVTCFTGCTKGLNPKFPDKQTADIIDLYTLVNNVNNIEAINQLISQLGIKRYTGSYSPDKNIKIDTEFKKQASKHLEDILGELEKLKWLRYEKLVELSLENKVFTYIDMINQEQINLKTNNFDKEKIRQLYKNSVNIVTYINSL